MTSTSNSKTTSGKNTSTQSPNTYSYQITSQFASSGSPGTCNSFDTENLQHMLDYALQSKRLPQKQIIKRELKAQASNQISSLASEDSNGGLKAAGHINTPPNIALKAKPAVEKLPDGAIIIQPTGGELYTGKGKGKRKKKNNKQIQMLEKAYKARNDWNRDDIINLAKFTGLTKSQIYKWNWDIRKRGKLPEHDSGSQSVRAAQQNALPFLPGGFGNKTVNLEAASESSEVSENKTIVSLQKMASNGSEHKSNPAKGKAKGGQQSVKNPYLQQLPQIKAFHVGKKEKNQKVVKKTTLNVSKKVKALENKFQKIHLCASHDSESRESNSTEMTPNSKYSNLNQFGSDTEMRTESLQESKQIPEKQQPPPSTPMHQQFYQYQNDNKGTANVTLLRYRNYSEANFNQDDETQSVPEIILENEEDEDCQENITNFIEQRQRSNSLGGVTSQQTQNYLDQFLLQNQSIPPPYSKKSSCFIPPSSNEYQNQQHLNYQHSDASSSNIRFGSRKNLESNINTGSFKQPSFKLDSLSSGNTAFKFINHNSSSQGGLKSQDRESSQSSWKLAFRQPGRENIVQSPQTIVNPNQKSGEYQTFKLPQDLSAQARIGGDVDESVARSSISGVKLQKKNISGQFKSSTTAGV